MSKDQTGQIVGLTGFCPLDLMSEIMQDYSYHRKGVTVMPAVSFTRRARKRILAITRQRRQILGNLISNTIQF